MARNVNPSHGSGHGINDMMSVVDMFDLSVSFSAVDTFFKCAGVLCLCASVYYIISSLNIVCRLIGDLFAYIHTAIHGVLQDIKGVLGLVTLSLSGLWLVMKWSVVVAIISVVSYFLYSSVSLWLYAKSVVTKATMMLAGLGLGNNLDVVTSLFSSK